MKSIIDEREECHVCGSIVGLERHHIFFGVSNRAKSEADGCWCYLCAEHHRGRWGVHGYDGYELNRQLKREAEAAWLRRYGKTIEDFIERYGKNYL